MSTSSFLVGYVGGIVIGLLIARFVLGWRRQR
jgi:uncharacterized membrane-anchored protein YhcB (DUF1043 family)